MEHRQKIVITEPSELKGVVDTVMREVMQRKDGGGATVLALHGELGAGKTTFTQTLARTLGVTDAVTSPTFVIMKLYELQHQSFETLIHIDAYRIEHSDEMRVLGFAPLVQNEKNIMCIEWAENITELLPEHTIHIRFSLEDEKRIITIEYGS